MKITHLGHACLLLEDSDTRLLLDPGNLSDVSRVGEGLDGAVDAIVVTHQHKDHVDPEAFPALVERNPGAILLMEASAAHEVGAGQAVALRAGETHQIGSFTLCPVGELHAEIHPYLDRVHNRGVVITDGAGRVFFHPGDALDAEPGVHVDLLAVPLNAPWQAVKETIAFVRRIEPAAIVPVHDGLLQPAARAMYLAHVAEFGLEGGVEVIDLAGGASHTL